MLFLYLLEKEEYQDYTHIWVLEDFEDNRKQIEKYEKYPNVRFVKYKSKEYCKELATVKYLVNNVSFPSYFLKREGQVLIDTWHGTPLKNMGFDIPGANISQGNTARNLLSADYIVSSGPYMTKTAYKDSYKMQNLYEGTVLEEGFPRNDKLFDSDRAEVIQELKDCGVDVKEDKKIILYAPTWRGEQYSRPDTDLQDVYKLINVMENSIDTNEYQIFVKLHQIVYHYMKENAMEPGDAQTKFIPATMDTNEILSVTDVLISDYSSIFYDFMLTGKPILYAGMGEKLSDLEQFYPDRMASRILGMGDVLTLIEKAQAEIDDEKAADMEKRFRKAEFTFNDYLDSMSQMKKMGGFANVLSMMPGIGGAQMKQIEDAMDEKKMARIEAIIYSMTPAERGDPNLINPSRKRRIAAGAGVDISEVNRLVKQFEQARKMMKQMPGMMGGKRGKRGMFKGLPF